LGNIAYTIYGMSLLAVVVFLGINYLIYIAWIKKDEEKGKD
jgi:hypothetical protein